MVWFALPSWSRIRRRDRQGAGRSACLRAVAGLLPRLLAELPHLDRRCLLPEHGAVLRPAPHNGRPRVDARHGRSGDGAESALHARLHLRSLRAGRCRSAGPEREGAGARLSANPDDWRFPAYSGTSPISTAGQQEAERRRGRTVVRRAAAIPGSPPYLLRLAAVLSGKGGEHEKAVVMWGQVYAGGDKYARQKAVDGLDRILPRDKVARMKALAPLFGHDAEDEFEALLAELFAGYAS